MKLSLRWSLSILFVGAVVIVTILSTAYGVNKASDSVRETMVDRQQKSGAGAATGLAYFLDSSRQSLISTASVLSATDLTAPGGGNAGPLLDPLVAGNRDFSFAALVSPAGEIALVRPMAADVPSDLASQPTFQAVKSLGVAQLALGPHGDPLHWLVPIPQSAGNPGYLLLGGLNRVFMEEILFANVDPSSTALILSQQDRIIAATDPAFQGDMARGWDALQDLRAGAQAAEADSPVDGRGMIVTQTSLAPRYEASIAVMSPRTQLAQLQSELIQSAIFTSAILATAAAILGIVATNTILRPVSDVRAATHRMREGDLAVRAAPRGARELQELAQDFNAMADTLSSEWEQRVKLQNHLEELVEERTEELNKRHEDMELFFYGVSHDFKSPVISISNITQMLEEALAEKRLDKSQLRALSRRIRNSSVNLQTLIGELLEFAQAERVAPKYQNVNSRALIAPVIDELQAQAAAKGVRLETKGPTFTVQTDPERVRHVVTNLVSNAIKYMPARNGSWVKVEWAKTLDQFEISVADNGDGIPESIRPQLFRPFSRYAPAGSKVAGAGLGLSIVKRLTESLHGTVVLETKERLGTTFKVRLPIRRPVTDRRGRA